MNKETCAVLRPIYNIRSPLAMKQMTIEFKRRHFTNKIVNATPGI